MAYKDPSHQELSTARAQWISDYVRGFEDALLGEQFQDPTFGYAVALDVDSVVDGILLYEFFKNQDAFLASTFFHKGSDTDLKLGPLWDFNISMGNSNYGPSGELEGWLLLGRPWADRLYQDPAFIQLLMARWHELRKGGLLADVLLAVDGHRERLRDAQARNFARWPIMGEYVWPNPLDPETGEVRQSYDEEVDFLRAWLEARAHWMDAHLPELQLYRGGL